MNSPIEKATLVSERFNLKGEGYTSSRELLNPQFSSSADFLATYPRGTYTTGRTVDRHSIFQLDSHVNRLVKSFRNIFALPEDQLHTQWMHEMLFGSLQIGVKTFIDKYPEETNEMKFCALATKVEDSEGFALLTYISSLSSFPPMVNVEARVAKRENPNVKDSQWISDRKRLEAAKALDANDVIMVTEDNEMLEGTQTNFFIVMNDTLITAPDSRVLAGTIRGAILNLAASHGIPVVLRSPTLQDVVNADAAFLTSSSRLLLPIAQLRFPEHSLPSKDFGTPPIVSQIQGLLQNFLRTLDRKSVV